MNNRETKMIEKELGMSRDGEPHVVFEAQVVVDQALSRVNKRPMYRHGIFCRIQAQGKKGFMSYPASDHLKQRYQRQWAMFERRQNSAVKPNTGLLIQLGVDSETVVEIQNAGYFHLEDLVNAGDLGRYEFARKIAERLLEVQHNAASQTDEVETDRDGSERAQGRQEPGEGDHMQLPGPHKNNHSSSAEAKAPQENNYGTYII